MIDLTATEPLDQGETDELVRKLDRANEGEQITIGVGTDAEIGPGALSGLQVVLKPEHLVFSGYRDDDTGAPGVSIQISIEAISALLETAGAEASKDA